ncbi:hypothetical protein AAGT13_10200, partial [Azotobacter salinestris]
GWSFFGIGLLFIFILNRSLTASRAAESLHKQLKTHSMQQIELDFYEEHRQAIEVAPKNLISQNRST